MLKARINTYSQTHSLITFFDKESYEKSKHLLTKDETWAIGKNICYVYYDPREELTYE